MTAITNCPNCGAPLKNYGRCDYCGTVVSNPVQCLMLRPGTRRIVGQMIMPLDIGIRDPEAAVCYAKRDVSHKIADALTEAVKFTVKKDFDPERFQEVICIRGELYVADPDIYY